MVTGVGSRGRDVKIRAEDPAPADARFDTNCLEPGIHECMVLVPPPSTPTRARDAGTNAAADVPLPSFDAAAEDEPTRVQSQRSLASTIPPPPRTGTFLRAQSSALRTASNPRSWASAPSWVSSTGESVRRHLPLSVRDRLHEYPGAKVLVVCAVAGIAFFGLFAATGGAVYLALRAPEAKNVSGGFATAAETTATPTAAAPVATPPATTKAPPKTADEASVLLDLADSLLADHRDADVPAVVARLIARQPELKNDAGVKRVLLSAAGSDDRKAAGDAYALLTGPMGEAGAALLYELSVDRTVRAPVRTRAQAFTASKDFEKVAALSVYAAAKLRNAKTCEDKHALLDFGANVGGKYVLDYLHELEGQTSCKPDDLVHCQPCLRNDSRLSDALAKLDRAAH
jgi:hypothetical protein